MKQTIIKTNDIKSNTIPGAIAEIEAMETGLSGDMIEAAASHIVYTDTDWDSENSTNQI